MKQTNSCRVGWATSRAASAIQPTNRNLGAGGWKPEEEAYTVAAAANVEIGSRVVTLDALFVYLHTAARSGLPAGFKIYVF
ncbi:MAG TPA: hypothetical protein VLA47_05395, partial [Nitrospira sp.]|nr:hypothetical protein [Nitrospira sp.]